MPGAEQLPGAILLISAHSAPGSVFKYFSSLLSLVSINSKTTYAHKKETRYF